MTQIRPQLGLAVPPVDTPLVDNAGRLTEQWRIYFERVNVILGPQDDLYAAIGEGINTANELQALEGRVSLIEGRTGEQIDPAVVDGLRSEIEALRASVGALQAQKDESEARLEALRSEINALAGSNSALMDQALSEINAQLAAAANQVEGTLLTLPRAIGELANKDSVGPDEINTGYDLLVRSSGAPTATSTRVYQDTSDGGVYADDGSNVVRLSPTFSQARLGTNTDFSSTSFQVVAQAALGTRLASALIWVAEVYDAFQAPDAATDATYVGQWTLYLSDTSQTIGSDPTTGGANLTALWIGDPSGLTFHAPVSAIVVNANDFEQDIYATPKTLGTTYAGAPAYLQLCLKRTAGAGAAKLSSAFGFDAFAVMG